MNKEGSQRRKASAKRLGVKLFSSGLSLPDKKNDNTCDNHDAAEQLAHGHAGSYEAQVGIRLAEQFNADTKNTIKYQKKCNHGA